MVSVFVVVVVVVFDDPFFKTRIVKGLFVVEGLSIDSDRSINLISLRYSFTDGYFFLHSLSLSLVWFNQLHWRY